MKALIVTDKDVINSQYIEIDKLCAQLEVVREALESISKPYYWADNTEYAMAMN